MASRSTTAIVKPALLNWARSSAGLSIEEAARSLQTKPAKITAWEDGRATPSMSQLRRMAATYKRLLSDFYLPEPPIEEPFPHDFRRLIQTGDPFHYSRSLRYQLRQARQRRALALDLAAELEVAIPLLPLRIEKNQPERVGQEIRNLLQISLVLQKTWRDPRQSYNSWRAMIERAGVLVFQFAGITTQEILGFSIKEQPLPVIAVNRKLKPNGRTFTLLHELVHILLDESAICDINEDEQRSPKEQDAEIFCNAAAAAALVPREALLAEHLVAGRPPQPSDWTDDELNSLARTFGVSSHVILRRLLTEGRTTKALYTARHAMWSDMFSSTQKERERDDEQFRRNMPQEVVSDLGRPLTGFLLDSYENSHLSLADVSRFLGVRASQVQKVRDLLARG